MGTMTQLERLMADISDNNKGFDAEEYKRAGHVAIGIKATEGIGFVNPTHHEWAQAARKQGLGVVHYLFAHPADSAREQVDLFWEQVHPVFYRPGDFVAFDVEIGTLLQAHDWLREADQILRDVSGTRPWCYAPLSYYEGANLQVASRRYWVAAWGAQRPRVRHGDMLAAWQFYGGTVGPEPHTAAGIPGLCDMSVVDEKIIREMRRHAR